MSRPINRWSILVLIAAAPRVLAAFFLPNTFGDAYVYIRDIGVMSTKMRTGAFALTDLYGFWLPLYQFLAAILNIFVRNGFYSGKLVSAAFGVGVCLFVYAITERITGNLRAALLAFLLIDFNPIHILTSSSALTDVPHAFLVLASLYFVLKEKWLPAAIFAALAGLTRVESWMLIALIPLIQLMRERRISISAIMIMLVPPVFWFYVSWKATGDWLACFKSRQDYHDWLLVQNPALAHFSLVNVVKDGAIFINSIDLAVLIATLVAGWIVLKRLLADSRSALNQRGRIPGKPRDDFHQVLPPAAFFFAFFALLSVAYLTHQQPIMFPRYGLILFSIGIPILAWTYLRFAHAKAQAAKRLLIAIIVVCVLGAGVQLVGAVGLLNQISAQRAAADYLRDHFDSKSDARIFSDEGTVTVMSGIAAERFLTSADAPKDREGFLAFLKEKKVDYLVYVKKEDSTPARLFSDPASAQPERFELLTRSNSSFISTDIRVLRVMQK